MNFGETGSHMTFVPPRACHPEKQAKKTNPHDSFSFTLTSLGRERFHF